MIPSVITKDHEIQEFYLHFLAVISPIFNRLNDSHKRRFGDAMLSSVHPSHREFFLKAVHAPTSRQVFIGDAIQALGDSIWRNEGHDHHYEIFFAQLCEIVMSNVTMQPEYAPYLHEVGCKLGLLPDLVLEIFIDEAEAAGHAAATILRADHPITEHLNRLGLSQTATIEQLATAYRRKLEAHQAYVAEIADSDDHQELERKFEPFLSSYAVLKYHFRTQGRIRP